MDDILGRWHDSLYTGNNGSVEHIFRDGYYHGFVYASAINEPGGPYASPNRLPVFVQSAAPTGLVADDVWATQVNLTWTDNSGIEAVYTVYYWAPSVPMPPMSFQSSKNSTSCAVTGLSPNTTYRAWVTAQPAGPYEFSPVQYH